jgi:hypothetical protein
MSKVIVLMDNESRRSDFINNYSFGKDPFLSTLCRMPTEAEIRGQKSFTFEVFGLFTNSDKLDNFIRSRDGLIVSIDSENFKKDPNIFISQLKKITDQNTNMPIAIVIDHNQEIKQTQLLMKILDLCDKHLEQNELHKVFISPYVKETGSILGETKFITFDNKIYTDSLSINRWFSQKLNSPKKTQKTKSTCGSAVTSRTISATKLMTDFYNETLPIELWDHYGRLRVVWCSLIRFGFEESILPSGWLCSSWRRYKTSIGHGDKWNYTLTRFWVNILAGIQESGKYKTFNELYENNPKIHSGKLFMEYYGNEIFSENAKNNWVQPTKQPEKQSEPTQYC